MTSGSGATLDGVKLLDAEFLPLVDARDDQALGGAIRRFTSGVGFDFYTMLVVHDDFSGTGSLSYLSELHNTPPEYLDMWADTDNGKVDPVLQHCKRSSVPIIYGRETYATSGQSERWERQAQFGYAFGLASAFHLPKDQHVIFGIDRRAPLPSDPRELTELVARFQLFGTFVQCAALGMPSACPTVARSPRQAIHLSPREHECLQWAAEGKTAWETGMILSIAEGSVAKILASAIRKLDCASKPQAVVKALRLGLIH